MAAVCFLPDKDRIQTSESSIPSGVALGLMHGLHRSTGRFCDDDGLVIDMGDVLLFAFSHGALYTARLKTIVLAHSFFSATAANMTSIFEE